MMNKGRRKNKKISQEQRIHEAAFKLFAQKGLEKTTIQAIAEEAAVSKATVMNYFPDKESIVLKLALDQCRKMRHLAQSLPAELDTKTKVLTVLLEDAKGIQSNTDHRRLMICEIYRFGKAYDLATEDHKKLAEIYQDILEEGRRKGEIAAWVNCRNVSVLIVWNYMHTMMQDATNEMGCSAEEWLTEFVELIWRGIAP